MVSGKNAHLEEHVEPTYEITRGFKLFHTLYKNSKSKLPTISPQSL